MDHDLDHALFQYGRSIIIFYCVRAWTDGEHDSSSEPNLQLAIGYVLDLSSTLTTTMTAEAEPLKQ